eukprot:TRINITY_DN1510_c0_g1_i1.p1 TRINITY_DN1510_c0_g1~~TRINITY_DN1510_c0_g1_i1.p1  ORF type:complete len:589 (-),score=160.89 TRINITY_DN1510_c0_g1_i1:65-1831(-)
MEMVMPHFSEDTSIANHPLTTKAVKSMTIEPPNNHIKQAKYLIHAMTHKNPTRNSLNKETDITSEMGTILMKIFESLQNKIIFSSPHQQSVSTPMSKNNSFKDGGLYVLDSNNREVTLLNIEVGIGSNQNKNPQIKVLCIKEAFNSSHLNPAFLNLIIILEKIENLPINKIKEICFDVTHFDIDKKMHTITLYNSNQHLEKEMINAFGKILYTLDQVSYFLRDNCDLFYSNEKLGRNTFCCSLKEGEKIVKKVTKFFERSTLEDSKMEGGLTYPFASSIGATTLENVECFVTPYIDIVSYTYKEGFFIPKFLSQVIDIVKQVDILRKRGLAHGNLTPKNILFSEKESTLIGFRGISNKTPLSDCNSIGLLLSMFHFTKYEREIKKLAKKMISCQLVDDCESLYSQLYKFNKVDIILSLKKNEIRSFWGNFSSDISLLNQQICYDRTTSSSIPINFLGTKIKPNFFDKEKSFIENTVKINSFLPQLQYSEYDLQKNKLIESIKEKKRNYDLSKFLSIKRRVCHGKDICGIFNCDNELEINYLCKEHNNEIGSFPAFKNYLKIKDNFTSIYNDKKTFILFLFQHRKEFKD